MNNEIRTYFTSHVRLQFFLLIDKSYMIFTLILNCNFGKFPKKDKLKLVPKMTRSMTLTNEDETREEKINKTKIPLYNIIYVYINTWFLNITLRKRKIATETAIIAQYVLGLRSVGHCVRCTDHYNTACISIIYNLGINYFPSLENNRFVIGRLIKHLLRVLIVFFLT